MIFERENKVGEVGEHECMRGLGKGYNICEMIEDIYLCIET